MKTHLLTMMGAVALALVFAPSADAQRHQGRSPSASRIATSSPRISTQGSNFGNRSAGHRWQGPGGDGRWGHHHHHHFYPRSYTYYSGFGYPYGYGYPFGFGYGYPYSGYGGFGTSLYYNGYNSYRSGRYTNGGGSVVAEVQQQLARAGYYRGAIDGVIGAGTRSAIRSWERRHGLPVDGRIDNRLLATMDLA